MPICNLVGNAETGVDFFCVDIKLAYPRPGATGGSRLPFRKAV